MRQKRAYMTFPLIVCLLCCSACSASGGQSGTQKPTREVERIDPAAPPVSGYALTESALRDTVAGWTAAKKWAEIRRQALEALRDEVKAQQEDLKRQLAELTRELSTERKAWRAKVRRGTGKGVLIGLAAGAVVGYALHK